MSENESRKQEIITIAGQPGSGKSTASKLVATKLGFQHFSTGDRFRQLGQEIGLSLLEANKHAEHDRKIDDLIDNEMTELGKQGSKWSIDSRLAWHFIPRSFKVYLELDVATAAERIIAKKQAEAERHQHEYLPDDPAVYTLHLQERLNSEIKRYKELYEINPYDISDGKYDLVVDTKKNTVEETTNIIIDAYTKWVNS